MHELQAGVEFCAPSSSITVCSSQSRQSFTRHQRKRFSRVVVASRHTLNPAQGRFAAIERLQCTLAISNLGHGDLHRVQQPLCVHCNVAFDAWTFLPAS